MSSHGEIAIGSKRGVDPTKKLPGNQLDLRSARTWQEKVLKHCRAAIPRMRRGAGHTSG